VPENNEPFDAQIVHHEENPTNGQRYRQSTPLTRIST
jgi:hypothetical protein